MSQPPTIPVDGAGPAEEPSPPQTEFGGRRPVIGVESADPAIMRVGDRYHVYLTNDRTMNVPKRTSTDLTSWSGAVDALPSKPPWAKDRIWAPHAVQMGNQFMLFYSARDWNNSMAIGYATSKSPDGPFNWRGLPGDGKLVTHFNPGVTIDPNVMIDNNGRSYLYWGSANGDVGQDVTGMRGQEIRLGADGRSIQKIGGVHISRKKWPADRIIVEAPWVMQRNGWYYMFYSDGIFHGTGPGDEYALKVARSRNPLDFNTTSRRVISGTPTYRGPGHPTITTTPDGWAVGYHAWVGGVNKGERRMMMDRLEWEDDWPVVKLLGDSVE